MQKVAQSWLVFTLTGSAFLLGVDSFLGEVPILLFSLVGGVVADRMDRRRLLLSSQYLQMAFGFDTGGTDLFRSSERLAHSLAFLPDWDRPGLWRTGLSVA